MKKLFAIAVIAASLAACDQKKGENAETTTDSANVNTTTTTKDSASMTTATPSKDSSTEKKADASTATKGTDSAKSTAKSGK